MRRRLVPYFFIQLFLLLAVACAKEELRAPDSFPEEHVEYNSYLLAAEPQTRAAITDDYVELSWDKKDTLSVYTTNGRFVNYVYDSQMEDGIVRFKGVLDQGEEVDSYVVYPAGDHCVVDGQLYVTDQRHRKINYH